MNCVSRTKSFQLRGVHYPLVHIYLAYKSIWLSRVDGGVALHMPADTTWTYGRMSISTLCYTCEDREKRRIYVAKWESDPDQSVVSRVTSCDTAKLFILSLYAQCIIHVWHTNIWATLSRHLHKLRLDLKSRTTSCRRPKSGSDFDGN